jgi:tRNA U34 5-methylaminomethyl-2-thiouridine-forming methyltransferase MnmC
MTTENLISIEITPEDQAAIEAAIKVLEKSDALSDALTPTQRLECPR